ncbi:MAG: hypothetical protein A2314_08755 [Elusimicrobia bacterium RIFOXYB2_FULL_50_12]|nr:MAG: hypothetical protein A2314_08755 [Elusimicrobia bacterium RIFOXYB2_FULL_50_12]
MRQNHFKHICIAVIFISCLPAFSSAAVQGEAYRSYLRGLLASRSGELKDAVREYERVIQLDGDAMAVYRDLTLAYWQLGEPEKSLQAAEKLGSVSEKNIDNQMFLGGFYLMAGKTAEARAAWEKALVLDPDNETALVYLAACSAGDDPQKAVEYWQQFVTREPASAEGYYQFAIACEKLGKLEKAREAFSKVISLRPESIEAYISIAQIYEKEGKFVAAVQQYERSLQLDPQNMTLLMYVGGLYYRLKNYAASEEIFLRAQKINPDDSAVSLWLGLLAEGRKDWAVAARYFEQVSRHEKNVSVLTRLSYYYSMLKNNDKALACLEKVVELEPDNAQANYLLGLANYDLKKYRDAEKNFMRALELKPVFEEVYFNLGILYERWKKFPRAIEYFNKAIALNPKNATALNYLGYSYADRNMNLEEADSLIRRALELDPENGAFIDSLGWLLYRKGRYEESERELQRAVEKVSDPVVWEHLGDVRMALNNTSNAWDAYLKALDLDPQSRSLKKKINKVRKLVLPKTLQRKALKRAVGNLIQISSLKAHVTVTGRHNVASVSSLGTLQYRRPAEWRLELLGSFLAPRIVFLQNKDEFNVYPRALDSDISPLSRQVFDGIKNYLNASILEEFDDETVSSKVSGDLFYYYAGDKSMLIDSTSGTVRRYKVDDQLTVSFKKHVLNEGLYLPSEIEVLLPGKKIRVNVTLRNVVINETMAENTFDAVKP